MTAPAWLSAVDTLTSSHNGGDLIDGPARFTWHTFEAPYQLTAEQGARSLIRAGNEVHFVLHPRGGLVQLLPATVAGRGLENRPGGVQTNRLGRTHLQVEVIGFADHPFTSDLNAAGRSDLARLVGFARAHGIPDVWPAGPPPRYPGGASPRGVRTWTMRAGHFGHSQVPENNHGDPGALDTRVLFATTPPPLEDHVQIYVKPDGAAQPGDGYLAVTPGGVHALTGVEWAVLKTDPAAQLIAVPRADWQGLRDLADVDAQPVDIPALAREIVAQLPSTPAGLMADIIAARTADLLWARLAPTP
jgi:hypothetical protein